MHALKRYFLWAMAFVISVSALLAATPLLVQNTVHAAGEVYKWIDTDTIEGSGGEFKATYLFNKVSEQRGIAVFDADSPGPVDKSGCLLGLQLIVDRAKPETIQLSARITTIIGGTTPGCKGDVFAKYGLEPKASPNEFSGTATAADVVNSTKLPAGQQPEARCELESFGWIICPILTVSANLVTWMGNILSDHLFLKPLTIPITTDLREVEDGQQARVAIFVVWQNIRNVANVLFLLFFMFAIFSIATSMGMSNYSVKKILPRVVVAAILINLSYYIFALAIDATNVLGLGIEGLFRVAIPSAPEYGSDTSDLALVGIAGIAGLGAVAITGVLAAIILPFVAGVVVGLFLLIAVVIFREVVIVFLVVLSPLAAALWILPNTENITGRFVVTARNILLIYPFLMAAIAVSNLAAQLILAIGYSDG